MSNWQWLLSFDVLVWVVPCALVCLALGAISGAEFAVRRLTGNLRRERSFLIKTLKTLVANTEQLTSDVGSHNSDLNSMHDSIAEVTSTADLEPIQAVLLQKIKEVVAANRRLEDDLVVTRFKLQEQAQLLDHTRQEAITDPLSGLGNRKSFDDAIQFAVSNFHANDAPFALVLADVDYFKRINDTYGHQAGDRVVTRIGHVLKQLCRSHDHLARFGGDEFAIVLMQVTQEQARSAAERIRTAVERINFAVDGNGGKLSVTFSLGLAFPQSDDTAETMIARADKALYESKRLGRNQLRVQEHAAKNGFDQQPQTYAGTTEGPLPDLAADKSIVTCQQITD